MSVTCDNASNNDTMVEEMDWLIASFSATSRTRCFLHIVNLIAKSLLKQFEIKKPKTKPGDVPQAEESNTTYSDDLAADDNGAGPYVDTDPDLVELAEDQEVEEESLLLSRSDPSSLSSKPDLYQVWTSTLLSHSTNASTSFVDMSFMSSHPLY